MLSCSRVASTAKYFYNREINSATAHQKSWNRTPHSQATLHFQQNGKVAHTKTSVETPELEFGDHSLAFAHRRTWELFRGLLVLRLCGFDSLVTNSSQMLKTGERFLGPKSLGVLVSPFYRQFVAGDTEEELSEAARILGEVRIQLMVAPMLESDVGENELQGELFQKNLEKTLHLIGASKRQSVYGPKSATPICQTKLTAHLSADILARISEAYESLTFLERKQVIGTTARLLGSDCYRGESQSLSALSLKEEDGQELLSALARLRQIGEMTLQKEVILTVDAEYTYVNPAISLLTLAMMKVFNKDKTLIWNTYQCYLKSTPSWLDHDLQIAEEMDLRFGVKLVRGAYIDRERHLSYLHGYSDPVNDTYEDTNKVYNRLAELMGEEVAADPKQRSLLVATHNEDSIHKAASLIKKLQIDPHSGSFAFAQVYGMAENISVPLAKAGYIVYKSVPYGSVSEVLPYLARRASENRAVFKGVRRERNLLTKQLLTRLPLVRFP